MEISEVEEAAGFCKVISKIRDSKKIVVGHNMFLDILYTLQQVRDTFSSKFHHNIVLTKNRNYLMFSWANFYVSRII